MILRELLASTPVFQIQGSRQRKIQGLAMDLELIGPDYLYIYVNPGKDMTYEDHVKEAIERGAVAICIGKEEQVLDCDVTFIRTYNVKRFLSAVTRNFYGNPSQSIDMIGITGSHGKTTTGLMVRSILRAAGISTVMINKSYCQLADEPPCENEDSLNPMVFTKYLSKALNRDIGRGIIECSYTTIIEERLRHIWFDSLIYTDLYTYFQNKERDYHYLEIRKTLIDHLKNVKCPIVVNMDDYYAKQLQNKYIVGYGVFGDQTIIADNLTLLPDCSHFTVHTPRGSAQITLGLAGLHNIYNAMAAIGWCVTEDIEFEYIKKGIERLEGLEHIQSATDITGEISVQTHKFASPNEVSTIIHNLSEESEYDEKVVIFSVPTVEDQSIYIDIGSALDTFGYRCIFTSDYEDRYGFIDSARAIAKNMKHSSVYYEMDRYKAIKKARSFTKKGGSIVIMTCAD